MWVWYIWFKQYAIQILITENKKFLKKKPIRVTECNICGYISGRQVSKYSIFIFYMPISKIGILQHYVLLLIPRINPNLKLDKIIFSVKENQLNFRNFTFVGHRSHL